MKSVESTCRFCGRDVEVAGAIITESRRIRKAADDPEFSPAQYVPFAEAWGAYGPSFRVSHPVCFADGEGSEALLAAVARHDAAVRPQRSRPGASDEVTVDLGPRERRLLERGLSEWGGPARCTREMALAMGFDDVADLFQQGSRIGKAILAESRVSRADWTRALLATEIVFSSNVVGSGQDWSITTGFQDDETIALLREVQSKLFRARVIVRPGYLPPRW